MEKLIKIVVEGGVVVDVEGLPDGWLYEVDDQDVKKYDGLNEMVE